MLSVIVIIAIFFIVAFIFVGNDGGSVAKKYGNEYGAKRKYSKSQKIGELGEQLVKNQGEKLLDETIYISFHNITVYNGEKTSQIDHLYFSVYGIFVVENKCYNGWIYGNQYDEDWTHTFGRDKKYKFKNPIRQNYGHIKFLENFLTIDFEKFHSVIVFSGSGEIKTRLPNNVCRLSNFCDYILSFQKPVFTQKEVDTLVDFFKSRFLPQTDTTLNFHIYHISK